MAGRLSSALSPTSRRTPRTSRRSRKEEQPRCAESRPSVAMTGARAVAGASSRNAAGSDAAGRADGGHTVRRSSLNVGRHRLPSKPTVSLSTRIFIIDQANHLSRLSGSRFAAMLSDPSAQPIPQFAARRVRGTETVVEQAHRRPVKVIRMVFFMLTFNQRGVLDADALMRQAAAAFDTVQPQTRSKGSTVLEAQSRFVVSGGRWKPTPALEAELRAVALGKQKCPVLKIPLS